MGEVIALQPRVGEVQAQLGDASVDAVLYQFPVVGFEVVGSDLPLAAGAESVSYFGIPYPTTELQGESAESADANTLHGADDADVPIDISREAYGGSLRYKRELGELAVKGLLDTPEGLDAITADYDDFRSGIGEMLKTAERLRNVVEVNRVKEHRVKNDRVLASDNKTYMDPLVEAGARSSRAAAEAAEEGSVTKRTMGVQAERDASDVWNVHRVNDIVAGRIEAGGRTINRRTVVSMFPQEAMDLDGDKPWNELKYMRGLAYIQDYYFDGKKVIASTYSISFSEKDKLRAFLNKNGFSIPDDAHTNDWVRHGRESTLEDDEGPDASLQELRSGYYASIRKKGPRYSTETLMDAEEVTMKQAFGDLNLPLSQSLASGSKHEAIHEFASQLLAHGAVFSSEVRQGLMRIVARTRFDDADGRLMDELIRYSVADSLENFAVSASESGKSIKEYEQIQEKKMSSQVVVPVTFSQRMANQAIEGARAGRSYGGCPGKRFKISSPETPEDEANSQDAFGGADMASNEGGEEEAYIPSSIRCIKCKKYSPREEVVHDDYWCCPKCSYKIDVCSGEELNPSDVDSEQEESVMAAAGAIILDFIAKFEEKRKAA